MSPITNLTAIRICLPDSALHISFLLVLHGDLQMVSCLFTLCESVVTSTVIHVFVVFHFCWQNCSCWDHYTEELWISCERQTVQNEDKCKLRKPD